jgi:hypothetical protein
MNGFLCHFAGVGRECGGADPGKSRADNYGRKVEELSDARIHKGTSKVLRDWKTQHIRIMPIEYRYPKSLVSKGIPLLAGLLSGYSNYASISS